MKNITLILALLLCSYTFGDNPCRIIDKKVADIDNQILYKAYCLFAGIDSLSEYVLVSCMDSAAELGYYTPSYECVYFDDKEQIKKIISFSEYISSVSVIGYYDESGDLMYTVSYDGGESIVAYSSKTYFNKGEAIHRTGKIQVDCVERPCYFRFENGKLHATETECFPSDYLSYIISRDEYINHVNKIKKWGPLQINILKDCNKVRFVEACVGDTATVNAFDVNIRKGPGMKEQIIDTILHQGNSVIVLKKQLEDREASLNAYPWYKIKYNIKDLQTPDKIGYIYGKYLDLIEKTIE